MADISKIVIPSGDEYDIKDSTSRSGLADKMDKTNPTGTGSFSLNRKANTTIGIDSFAEGYDTTASGYISHAEGTGTTASGISSHAEGYTTTASGSYSHAEGTGTSASGEVSHAEGFGTSASGANSHAEGRGTIASGAYSHADGWRTTANHASQHVFGEYNALDDSSAEATVRGNYVEIVGNGTADNSRSNARTLDWSGNEVLSGTIEATGFGTTLDKEVDRGGVQLTQSEYDALVSAGTVDANTTYFITDGQNITTASAVTYDNTSSGMTATNVQGAIDEINSTTAPLFYLGSYTYTAASVAAGDNITISKTDFSITDVTGYTPLAVKKVGVSKAGFNITSFNASGVSSVLSIRNDTSAAIADTTFTIDIIYVKSNFLQSLT